MGIPLVRRCSVLLASALILPLAGAVPARAGTVSMSADGVVTYTAAPGELNDVVVDDDAPLLGSVVITESGSVGDQNAGISAALEDGCLSLSENQAECPAAPVAGVGRVVVDVGDGAQNTVDVRSAVPAELLGGPGDDTLTGGTGADVLVAGDGVDRLSGGDGPDQLTAGAGRDQLFGDEGDDQLIADDDGDDLTGGDGNDTLAGGAGDDHLTGGDGGSSGSPEIPDDDQLTGGAGVDVFDAGRGDDDLRADGDDTADVLHCGDGQDHGTADLADELDDDCEAVVKPSPPPPDSGAVPPPADPGAPPPADQGAPPPADPGRTTAPPPATDPGDPFDVPLAPVQPSPSAPKPSELPLLRPRPEVRIAGVLTVDGARIRILQVKAPRGTTVRIRCIGKGCPMRASKVRAGGRKATPRLVRMRITRLQRDLRAGTVIQISVTQRGTIGKFTRLLIRRGKAPRRTDLCLRNHGRHPFACPA